MVLYVLCAFIVAFLISRAFGKRFIPWLKKHDAIEGLKKEVEERFFLE